MFTVPGACYFAMALFFHVYTIYNPNKSRGIIKRH